MLAYLDALCAALMEGHELEVRRLLSHPLARHLPRRVRDEARELARPGGRGNRTPVFTLRFRHQMSELLVERLPIPSDPATQLELPLRMRQEGFAASVSLARAAHHRRQTGRRAG